MGPLVSIGVLCYNQAQYVVQTLNSVINQNYKNFELIIVDDFSQDNSVEIIKDWIVANNIQCSLQLNSVNSGICAAANKLITGANGKYLSMIAADDIMRCDKISTQVDILENSGEDVAFVYSDANIIDGDGKLTGGKFISLCRGDAFCPPQSGDIFGELLVNNFIPFMGCLFKTSVFVNVGLFDADLSYEDYDLLLRITSRYNAIYSNYVSVDYRIHSNNATKKLLSDVAVISTFKLLAKHIGEKGGVHNKVLSQKLAAILVDLYRRKHRNTQEYVSLVHKHFKNQRLLKIAIQTGIPYDLMLNIYRPLIKIKMLFVKG